MIKGGTGQKGIAVSPFPSSPYPLFPYSPILSAPIYGRSASGIITDPSSC